VEGIGPGDIILWSSYHIVFYTFVVKLNRCDIELKGITYDVAVKSLNDIKFLYFCIMWYICLFFVNFRMKGFRFCRTSSSIQK
jgi:hypothetical protein